MLLQNGHTVVCAPLVQFLQYQQMGSAAKNTALFSEPQPRVTANFLGHRSSLLTHLNASGVDAANNASNAAAAGGASSGGPFGMSATQFQAFVKAMGGRHISLAPSATVTLTSTGTVDKCWSINLPTLLKLTQVDDVNLLPPVWAAIAKGPHKEEHNILQAALDSHIHTAGAATNAKLTLNIKQKH